MTLWQPSDNDDNECQHCGAHVTDEYIRMFSREDDLVYCCPECPDRVRTNGEVREARSQAVRGTGSVRADGGEL